MPAGKDKGTGRYGPRQGMGRLRRENAKGGSRLGGWERHADDDDFLARHETSRERRTHHGERLISRFNRAVALGEHEEAAGEPAEVCEVRPGCTLVRFADGREEAAQLRRALEKRVYGVSNTLCAGDRVRVEREAGSLVIGAIEPRANQLARADSHNRSLEHILAANVGLLVVVGSVAEPDFKAGFVDRWLVIAAAAGIAAAVVVNKRDRGDAQPLVDVYRNQGLSACATVACDPADPGVAELRTVVAGRVCVIAGQSGVGKSSLVNALFPGCAARIGLVADAGHGRHTTTSARSYVVPGGGRLIDTPGVREVVVGGLTALDVALYYPELAALQPACRFGDCTHRHEPGCAVREALEAGRLSPSRYFSYASIVDEDLAGGA
jgi:ribosome biogenesis GTPase